MTITCDSSSITINDILIGDVWLCSGQSNMEINMQRVSPLYKKEIADSKNTNIRYFVVPKVFNFKVARKDLSSGEWISPNIDIILKKYRKDNSD